MLTAAAPVAAAAPRLLRGGPAAAPAPPAAAQTPASAGARRTALPAAPTGPGAASAVHLAGAGAPPDGAAAPAGRLGDAEEGARSARARPFSAAAAPAGPAEASAAGPGAASPVADTGAPPAALAAAVAAEPGTAQHPFVPLHPCLRLPQPAASHPHQLAHHTAPPPRATDAGAPSGQATRGAPGPFVPMPPVAYALRAGGGTSPVSLTREVSVAPMPHQWHRFVQRPPPSHPPAVAATLRSRPCPLLSALPTDWAGAILLHPTIALPSNHRTSIQPPHLHPTTAPTIGLLLSFGSVGPLPSGNNPHWMFTNQPPLPTNREALPPHRPSPTC
jgi:hypothetical protein